MIGRPLAHLCSRNVGRDNLRSSFVAILLALIAAPASADGVVDKIMTAADKSRLEGYAAARDKAVAEAKARGAPQDVATLDALLAKPLVSFSDLDMTGNWQCRTIKAGGDGGLVVYGWFKCKVTDDGSDDGSAIPVVFIS